MNRSSRLISRMMLAFFIAVFGPILLLSWRDWHELLQIGKKTSALVDSALNVIRFSPTPFALFTPTSPFDVHPTATYTPTLTRTLTKTPAATYTPSRTQPSFLSGTPNDRSQSSPTVIASHTSTSVPFRTATHAPTSRPPDTSVPPTHGPPTARPTSTPPPTARPPDTPAYP